MTRKMGNRYTKDLDRATGFWCREPDDIVGEVDEQSTYTWPVRSIRRGQRYVGPAGARQCAWLESDKEYRFLDMFESSIGNAAALSYVC